MSIPNEVGSNIIRYLNEKVAAKLAENEQKRSRAFWATFAESARNQFEDELTALDSVNAAAASILALSDTADKPEPNPACMYTIAGSPAYVGFKLNDGRVFVEPADQVDRSRAGSAVERIAAMTESLMFNVLDLIAPEPLPVGDKPDEDADYADPRVDYSASVCYCDSTHPMYKEPKTMGQYRNCPRHPVRW